MLCNCTAKTKTIKTKDLAEAQTSQLNKQEASVSALHSACTTYTDLPGNADKAAAAQACPRRFTQSQFCEISSERAAGTGLLGRALKTRVLTMILVQLPNCVPKWLVPLWEPPAQETAQAGVSAGSAEPKVEDYNWFAVFTCTRACVDPLP